MKIGIITLPFNNNYGGYLQAYALLKVLKSMKHEPTLIMRREGKLQVTIWYRIKFAIKGILKRVLRGEKYPLVYRVEELFYTKGERILPFINKYMQPQTSFLYSSEELRKECEGRFDAYVVGSDQVWRPGYVPKIGNYFLDFTRGWNVLRIAYAASFGMNRPKYTEQQKEICGKLISFFDAVSVRENSGIDVIENFGWKAKGKCTVLDPTMLLGADVYNSLLPSTFSVSHGKVFCYVLDEKKEIVDLINRVCLLLNCQMFDFFNSKKRHEYYYSLPSIEDWLAGIRDADFVVTDSFHGVVFSIIFNKPFIVSMNKERGADRFFSLLQNFDLEDRIVEVCENVETIVKKNIDWDAVNEIISRLQNESMNYLRGALNHVMFSMN